MTAAFKKVGGNINHLETNWAKKRKQQRGLQEVCFALAQKWAFLSFPSFSFKWPYTEMEMMLWFAINVPCLSTFWKAEKVSSVFLHKWMYSKINSYLIKSMWLLWENMELPKILHVAPLFFTYKEGNVIGQLQTNWKFLLCGEGVARFGWAGVTKIPKAAIQWTHNLDYASLKNTVEMAAK